MSRPGKEVQKDAFSEGKRLWEYYHKDRQKEKQKKQICKKEKKNKKRKEKLS